MDSVSSQRTDPEYSGESIAARSEVSDLSEILHAVTLFLERIVRIGIRFYHDALRLDLERLFRIGCQHERTVHAQSGRYRRFADLLIVLKDLGFIYYLHRLEKSTVVQLDETELVRSSVRSDPASYSDIFSGEFICSAEQISDIDVFHDLSFSFSFRLPTFLILYVFTFFNK